MVYLSNVPKFTEMYKDQLKKKKKISEKVQRVNIVDINDSELSEF